MTPEKPDRVLRHAELTRSFHWLLIFWFLGLFITGIGMVHNIEPIAGLVGSFRNLSWLHIALGLGLICLTIIYIILCFERYCYFIDNISHFGKADWLWVKSLGRDRAAVTGKYHTGQKIFAWLMIIAITVMCISGVLLVRYYTGLSLGQLYHWYYVHLFGAVFIFILLAGHAIIALFMPGSKGLGGAMLINGYLDAERAEKKYPHWFQRLKRSD